MIIQPRGSLYFEYYQEHYRNMSTAVIFPGQGSQEQGMGRYAAEQYGWAMALWETAEKESGLPLRDIYWEGEAEDMADTRALQPALTATCISLWLTMKQVRPNLKVSALAGHSLGEYAALAAAGVLSPEEAIKATTLRGRLMAESGGNGHGMAAIVKVAMEQVEQMVAQVAEETGKVLVVANYNSPAQFVVSGEKDALVALGEQVKQAKGRAIPLAVSGAFHSPLIEEAASEFKKLLETLSWKTPSIPVFFNSTAKPEKDSAAVAAIMAGQMTSSVYWVQIMQNMYAAGARKYIEVGPKNVLTKLVGQNLKGQDGLITETIGSLYAISPE